MQRSTALLSSFSNGTSWDGLSISSLVIISFYNNFYYHDLQGFNIRTLKD